MQRVELRRTRRQGPKESEVGPGSDHGDQVSYYHPVTMSGDKNQASSKLLVDSNSRDKPESFPQGNGKGRAGERQT